MPTNVSWRPAWWLEPARLGLFLFLPIFLAVAILGPSGFQYYGNFINNINAYIMFLGIGSTLAFSAGALTTTLFRPSSNGQTPIDPSRGTNALRVLGIVAVGAHLIFLSPFLFQFDIIVELLSGNMSAMYDARETAQKLPGITSFMQVGIVFCSVLSALRLNPHYRVPKDVRLIFAVLIICVVCRVVVWSERLALVELLIAFYLTPIAFRWQPSLLRGAAPLWSIVGLFVFFAFGEYFRSWQYYKYQGYDSYLDFVLQRFVGYFSTSINNAGGIILYFDPIGFPAATARWFYKLLLIFGTELTDPAYIFDEYLVKFANLEFNNVSGLYVPFIDFGLVFGLVIIIAIGAISEGLYRSFSQLRPAGLIIYPTWYVGLLDFIRVFYWGDARFIPVLVPAVCVVWFVRANTKKQPSGSAHTRLVPSNLAPKD
jgi:oligosaccharide repeat unit polymerase